MPRGVFTQSAIILLNGLPTFDQIQTALKAFRIGKVNPASTGSQWMGGASMTLFMREEVNGLAVVDLVTKPWPDSMGNPKGNPEEVDVFGAWVMGSFGPAAFPGNLTRIVEQDGLSKELKEAAERHTAFLRIRSSYVLGGGKDAKILPQDYDAVAELHFVTGVACALLKLPQAQAYFNPNGETLHDAQRLDADLKHYASIKLVPLPVWSSVRLFNVDAEWCMMDSVGMDQFFVQDSEACFSTKKQSPDEVSRFLWNIGDYLRQKGPVIKNRDTMNGPGDVNWRAFKSADSMCSPPRPTLRWFPLDGSRAPAELIPAEKKSK
jgi:hypothetical protein